MKGLCGYQGATSPIILRTAQSQNKLNSVHYYLIMKTEINVMISIKNSNHKKASEIKGMNL